MSDIRYCPRDFLKEFIELYKSLPCLWKVKSREYNDRNKKNKAYDILIEKYREVDSSATRDTVTKKINSLRSTYRKEMLKAIRSEQNGEKYTPSLWYYNLLKFLTDQDLSDESKRILDESNASYSESNWEYSEPVVETDTPEDDSGTLMERSNQSSEYEFSRACPTLSEVSKAIKRPASEEVLPGSKVMQLVAEKFRRTDNTKSNLNESFGRYVANEVDNLPPEMVPHVKKIINLALFEGNMKTLNVTSCIKTYVNQTLHSHYASGESRSSTEPVSELMK